MTNLPFHICYDVTGQSQQSIFILQDKFVQTKIEGVLFDDYYMHRIKIYQNHNSLVINRKSIEYNGKYYDWFNNGRLIFENLLVYIKDNEIKVKCILGKHQLTTVISKSINNFGIEYLDVHFENMSKNENRYCGLLGDINGKEISILEGKIQENNIVSVKVDNELLLGRWERRSSGNCILLSFDKLIKPEMKKNYIY